MRQSDTATGIAPPVATLRYASASANCAPRYGSRYTNLLLQSVATETPRPVDSSIRIMPESDGWARTLLPRTYRSYCDVTHSFDAWFGDETRRRMSARSSSGVDGRGSFAEVSAINAS